MIPPFPAYQQRQESLRFINQIFTHSDVVYISGPMTGVEDFNRPLFTKVKKMVAQTGATVLSPADIKQGPPWEQQMKQCVRHIADSTKMVMLPGWENSRGALIEHMIACQVMIPRLYLEDNLMRASTVTLVTLDLAFMTRFMDDRLHINPEDT